MFRITYIVLFGLFIALQSCGPADGVWKNDEIDAGIRQKLHALNEEVFDDLKQKRELHLEYNLALELINHSRTRQNVEILGHELRTRDYQLFDEYYTVAQPDTMLKIQNRNRGLNSYDVHTYTVARQMYTTFYLPRTGINRKMITLVYAKFDYGWKLYHWDIRPYMYNGHTALELLELAKRQIAQNYISDTRLTMQMASACLRPSDIVKYPDDSAFVNTYRLFMNRAKEIQEFPITLGDVSSKPQILGVYTKETPNGFYPMIGYLSTIDINDTLAVKAENLAVMKVIGNVLPGIDKDKKLLFHRVYNKESTAESMQPYFDMRTEF
ncbi:hypothetical protein [Mucilaginibacter myungsuensis]|uniref:Uncharacterized protein n=1 Tax=Mucilaginibacter myungsuensis TaxID=649104 RepID=A0A929PVI2_9SPHI|nr:hypothetical protein [Mucilaginibacter myungsuensis]MBE9661159.1 hypothetical protein [Mucilaginibacter myungsuensis]MDN3597304.1 hypothetical protein [Mucilaginibacter myungsuensis]